MSFLFLYFVLNTANAIVAPGVGYIGSTLHLLNGFDPFGSIITQTYDLKQTTPDKMFDLPDRLMYVPHSTCSLTANSYTVDSLEQYQTQSTSSINVKGAYKMFSGAYSQTTNAVKNSIDKYNEVVSMVSAKCIEYELNLVRQGGVLNAFFLMDAKQLPANIDTESHLDEYIQFFDYYGTHIITGCEVGGKLQQYSFTNKQYHTTHSLQTINQNADGTFFITVDGSKSSTTIIDTEYTKNTATWSIETTGGKWPSTLDNWTPWIHTIQNNEKLACIDWAATEISDVWAWHSELQATQTVVEQALIQYFDRKGCTSPTALNYDQYALINVGCQYETVPEFRICFQETEGSSQCQGTRASCSDWSSIASMEDLGTWTKPFRDDTDSRPGGCKYQWKIEQRDSGRVYGDGNRMKYRMCFKETEGSSQCQDARDSCTGWNDAQSWSAVFRDDTDGRGGGCTYQWFIEQELDSSAPPVHECRLCFQEVEHTSDNQCQGARNTCSGWSKSPVWSAVFRDDTDNRGGGCKYQWKFQCI
eukprot:159140_1